MKKWLDTCSVDGSTRLTLTYDDLLDVLRGLLMAIPVDEAWYLAQYPAVATFVARFQTESATSHFHKHGYFEDRRPFAPGWQGLSLPVRFTELKTSLNVVSRRGRLLVDIDREAFLVLVRTILRAVPVDSDWYQKTYPAALRDIKAGKFNSAVDHYVEAGYFVGYLPFDVTIDEDWYVTRYEHVRNGLERGMARSAKDHFIRLGYNEGCRPASA